MLTSKARTSYVCVPASLLKHSKICIKIYFDFVERYIVCINFLKAFNSNVIAGASQWLALFHRPLELRDIINPELQHHALHTLHNSDLSPFVCYQSDSKNSISPCWSRCEYKLTFTWSSQFYAFRFQNAFDFCLITWI